VKWYEKVAKSKPPKDCLYYHILVDGSDQRPYAAEQSFEHYREGVLIHHDDPDDYFRGFDKANYIFRNKIHQ
jgi:heat shock protein HspQ